MIRFLFSAPHQPPTLASFSRGMHDYHALNGDSVDHRALYTLIRGPGFSRINYHEERCKCCANMSNNMSDLALDSDDYVVHGWSAWCRWPFVIISKGIIDFCGGK